MNLKEHAISELTRAGLMPTDCEMQNQMNEHILKMVETFSEEGHSGFSASYALGILQKLLNFEPLSPIEDKPENWNYTGDRTLQHKHCSHVFKDTITGDTYSINGNVFRNQNGCTFTNNYSSVPVKFPYTPKKPNIVDVYERIENQLCGVDKEEQC